MYVHSYQQEVSNVKLMVWFASVSNIGHSIVQGSGIGPTILCCHEKGVARHIAVKCIIYSQWPQRLYSMIFFIKMCLLLYKLFTCFHLVVLVNYVNGDIFVCFLSIQQISIKIIFCTIIVPVCLTLTLLGYISCNLLVVTTLLLCFYV